MIANAIKAAHKVLIVESCVTLASLAGLYLKRRFPDMALVEAHSCDEARSALTEHDFEALIVDGSLPDGEGLELLGEVDRLCPSASVILTSPCAPTKHFGEMDFFWLIKPFRLEDLGDLVARLLRTDQRKR